MALPQRSALLAPLTGCRVGGFAQERARASRIAREEKPAMLDTSAFLKLLQAQHRDVEKHA